MFSIDCFTLLNEEVVTERITMNDKFVSSIVDLT